MFDASRRRSLAILMTCAVASVALGACATGGSSSARYQNFLVVGLADNYDNQVQYERAVADGLKSRGAQATPFFEAAGGKVKKDPEVLRARVRDVVQSGNYDAVLVTRILERSSELDVERGSAAVKSTRRGERPIDFFRYDYEELNEPLSLKVETQVTVAGEVYEVGSETMVWSTELESPKVSDLEELIDKTAAGIVRRVGRAGLIAR